MKKAAGTRGKTQKQPKGTSYPIGGAYPNYPKGTAGNLNKRGIRRGKKR